ncbi:MAG: HAD-IIIC family phosphatase [Candidatus Omnitrophica bacterium]|nr:HAD-IIIC family phosphatase [Candidatus Omnitrophota bacterium]
MSDLAALKQKILQVMAEASESDAAYVQAADLLQGASLEGLPPLRLAVLRSFTIEPLIEVLKVKLFLEGYRLELFLNEFNQVEQEILDPQSRFYRFSPQVVFLAVRLEELCPALLKGRSRLSPPQLEEMEKEVLSTLSGWIEMMIRQGIPNFLLSNFLVPPAGPQGIFDLQTPAGQIPVIRRLNLKLLSLREPFPQMILFDLELLASGLGKAQFLDPLQYYRMSNPYALSAYPAYGEFLLRHLKALLGHRRKCLVLDLDDTLWGGVLGEEGIQGVKLSDTYPGNCYKDFQKGLLELHDRGILLAVNSKNNLDEALAMIRTHPEMILREESFSAVRINWKDKAENLLEIAQELNLGLDAFVFMDDSPAECQRIREAFPEVMVAELSKQAHRFRSVLENLGCFEQIALTPEDRSRTDLYRTQGQRQKLASQSGNLEEFYAGLKMCATLYRNDPRHVSRIAQITQKTNQFNLTTRRYTESEILRFMKQGMVYALRLEDRFGDNGIIAAAIVLPKGTSGEWVIDSFLMSCRVILRTVEDTFLGIIAQEAEEAGKKQLVGIYLPTARNGMVNEFYLKRGFRLRRQEPSGEMEYLLELGGPEGVRPSPWIQLKTEVEIPR